MSMSIHGVFRFFSSYLCGVNFKLPMDEEKPKKKHKKNWREEYASVTDIETFLSDRIMLRYNVVTRRVEYRLVERSVWDSKHGRVHGSRQWENISDRIVNSLWTELSATKPVRAPDIYRVIESDFVPEYDPFRFYLEQLPTWKEEQGDAIMELSLSVNIRGDADEQMLFYEYLKKWMVAMVASWMEPTVVNNVMLVLIGEQGSYKTTWFANLLPPTLRGYFYTKTNSGLVSKDDLLVLSQYGLVCWEGLDTMQQKELNKLKAAMTMPSINERAAYERYHENRPHLASFCGTGNNVQFLSDTTGTRRWLPFEVDSIESPLTAPFNYDAIYAQAYRLYHDGFRFWFDRQEIERLSHHNRQFETARLEHELVQQYFRIPKENEPGEFLPVAMALQIVGAGITQKLSTVLLGRAFSDFGFQKKTYKNVRGYIVVRRSAEEMRSVRHLMADSPEHTDTDDTDVF